jgi:hypothetical protein
MFPARAAAIRELRGLAVTSATRSQALPEMTSTLLPASVPRDVLEDDTGSVLVVQEDLGGRADIAFARVSPRISRISPSARDADRSRIRAPQMRRPARRLARS